MLKVHFMTDPADARNSFSVAMKHLMRPKASSPSTKDEGILWAGGHLLTDLAAHALAHAADKIGRDVVYLNFDSGRVDRAPADVTILAMRDGAVHRYDGCSLWAPADGGPAMLITRGKGCFSWDGTALVPHAERPVTAIGEGVARARSRLRRALAEVTTDETANFVKFETRMAA